MAAEGRSTKVSSSTRKDSPSEVTPGGRPPRERMKSKKVMTSTMVVVGMTVVETAAAVAAVVDVARVVGVVARAAKALVADTAWAVVETLPEPDVETIAAALVDCAVAPPVAPPAALVELVVPFAPTGWIVPSRMSYRSFLSDEFKAISRDDGGSDHTCKT